MKEGDVHAQSDPLLSISVGATTVKSERQEHASLTIASAMLSPKTEPHAEPRLVEGNTLSRKAQELMPPRCKLQRSIENHRKQQVVWYRERTIASRTCRNVRQAGILQGLPNRAMKSEDQVPQVEALYSKQLCYLSITLSSRNIYPVSV